MADSEATKPDAIDLIAEVIRQFYHGDDRSMTVSVERLEEYTRAQGQGLLLDDPDATVGEALRNLFEDIADRMGVSSEVSFTLLPTNEVKLERTHPKRKPDWAERVIDQFFEAIERGEHGLEITLKDDALKAEELASELEAEIERRRFTDVIVVSHGERSVDLEFLSGNLDVYFGNELDNLSVQTKVIEDFLASGETSLSLDGGVSPTEARRHLGLLAAAADGLDNGSELALQCQGSTIIISKV